MEPAASRLISMRAVKRVFLWLEPVSASSLLLCGKNKVRDNRPMQGSSSMYQVRRVHIGKTAQLDELVRACERLYSHTLVSFWRTLRHKGIWLAPKHLMR
jgi:hypothetical protein